MAVEPISSTAIRRDDSQLCGRLVALSKNGSALNSKNPATQAPFQTALSIDFPAMPDTVELIRTAEYRVLTNMVLPDGIHQYMRTNVLEIPFSFRLHAEDYAYCKKGALTLLQVAARLHSFILPIGRTNQNTYTPATARTTGSILAPPPPPSLDPAQPNQLQGANDAGQQQADAESSIQAQTAFTGKQNVYNPVTCWLHLIYIDDNTPGISCVGYVKEVGVKLNGPWRRSQSGGFNLPTSGDFSFTFVHRPGHGNSNFQQSGIPDNINLQPQAYANDVLDKLFNTRSLVVAESFYGLEDTDRGSQ